MRMGEHQRLACAVEIAVRDFAVGQHIGGRPQLECGEGGKAGKAVHRLLQQFRPVDDGERLRQVVLGDDEAHGPAQIRSGGRCDLSATSVRGHQFQQRAQLCTAPQEHQRVGHLDHEGQPGGYAGERQAVVPALQRDESGARHQACRPVRQRVCSEFEIAASHGVMQAFFRHLMCPVPQRRLTMHLGRGLGRTATQAIGQHAGKHAVVLEPLVS